MILDGRNEQARAAAVEVLASGGIALLPCDTMYGICGGVPDTEERIRRIKGRAAGKQFIILIGDRSLLAEFTVEPVDERLVSFWPSHFECPTTSSSEQLSKRWDPSTRRA
jgi:tRNA A37 threonylcarbamoyladenosine synthetase subunit TsaC/SUA5/YrdC